VVCIGLATVVEKYYGTPFVSNHIYGAWWFSALWAALTVAALAYIMRQQLYRRVAVMLLHLSFVVILAGALLTHLFSTSGQVKLRIGVAAMAYLNQEGRVEELPFTLTLKEFRIVNYPGTNAPLDYQSIIQSGSEEIVVSMNNIANIQGYRLYQSNYDSDGMGVTLGVSHDPYGIAVTYIGYLLLLVGIIATLLSRHTQLRTLYRQAITIVLLFMSVTSSAAPQVVPDIAKRMGTIPVLYNNRICPLNTVATDFVTKLTGSASWQDYTADEIFVGWMIYYTHWEKQKLIRIKSRDVQGLLGIDGQWASFSDFLDPFQQYKLKDAMDSVHSGSATPSLRKALMDADEKYHLVEMFYRGQFLRIFPYNHSPLPSASSTPLPSRGGAGVGSSPSVGTGVGSAGVDSVAWYAPGAQSLPRDIPVKEQFFIKQSMDFLTESIVTGQRDRAFEIIAKIKLFQRDMIGDMLPSDGKVQAELFYNKLRSLKFPVLITLQLGLRWWLSGHVPVSNGYETMLFLAWVLLVLTILLFRRVRIILWIGPLAALCCLLVAMMTGSGSQLTPLMPVLQSPLLSFHVMTVMCAYALFALQLMLGIHAFLLLKRGRQESLRRTTALSQLLLYPAVSLLTVGIFLGAVWANVSWGSYWSWDPKESWALITLMVYAVPLHKASVGIFRNPRFYHAYMVTAFLVVVITYFGVNYLLGGMHSYA